MGTKRREMEAERAAAARLKFLEEAKRAPKPAAPAPKKAEKPKVEKPKAEEPKSIPKKAEPLKSLLSRVAPKKAEEKEE